MKKINEWMIGVIVLVVIFGGIGMTKRLGIWTTESDKVPNKITSGINEGNYDPFDIRGSYTFEEVSTLYGIDITYLAEAFDLGSPEEALSMKTKDLEALYEFSEEEVGNSSVQVFVALMKEMDIEGAEAYLPDSAVKVLLNYGPKLDDIALEYIETHTIDNLHLSKVISSEEYAEVKQDTTDVGEKTSDSGENEFQVNGTSTFSQVLALGISEAEIMQVIEGEMPPTNQKVRDYCTEHGLSFSVVKQALNDLLLP